MIAVALAQIRIHWARFLAIGLGIALASGFVATTLIINSSLQDSLEHAVGRSFEKSDLTVVPSRDVFVGGDEASPLLGPLSEVDGVDTASLSARTVTTGRGASFSESSFALSPVPADERLDTFDMVSGQRPEATTDLVLDTRTASDLGVGIGDEIRFTVDAVPVESGNDDMPIYRGPSKSSVTFSVVGIAEMGQDPALPGATRALTTSSGYQEYFAQQGDVIAIQIALEDGADREAVRAQLQRIIDGTELNGSLEALSVDDAVTAKTDRLSGGNAVVTGLLLVFAGISVIVAILVVSNTFSVIVAGRRREFALLRCLGATRLQMYGSVVAEGLFVGLLGSIFGVFAGVGVSRGLMAAAVRYWPEEFPYDTLTVPVSALVGGVVVGALLTIVATIRPARSAIAVTPLEALQPFDASISPSTRSRPRHLVGFGFIGLGVVLVIVSVYAVSTAQLWVLGGALGGGLVVTGLVISSAKIIPPVVAWTGEVLFSPWGVPGQLATLNTMRNPRRTAATATALIIGVTLVATILVGGMSTKATLSHGLDQRYPVDISVPLSGLVDDDDIDDVREIPGVSTAVIAHRAEAVEEFKGSRPEIFVIDPDSAETVLGDAAADIVSGRVTVPEDYRSATVRVKGLNELSVPVHRDGLSSLAFFTTPEVGNDLGISATSTAVLVRLDEDVEVDEITRIRHSVAETLDVSSEEVGGSAVARGAYSELIDVMLAGAVALLFVSVIIALIGVSNTVSLSVIERRRENALMRALGLSIAQLRTLLALEAVLISSVAAVLGLVLGGALGIVGTRLVTHDYSTDLIVDFSSPSFLGILAVAVVAGILSALAPARRASRLSPVEGLKLDF
ncbi:putative ABC transport system permease protein [Brevibacterium siliguriense]|uniref:Putative ABC transport system permease protein n=1 Tax=Brevibacterium siliguriense TaxID=1136497 RepID=A0A1H1V329_9MICO|nr:ABC transporter permease [Brevibacterium siliguriense]SDS79093.1 putative ABC transport system permease protein [Brevibacterium siliguriense]